MGEKANEYFTVDVLGNPGVVDPVEWDIWTDPDLSYAEKKKFVAKQGELTANEVVDPEKIDVQTSTLSFQAALDPKGMRDPRVRESVARMVLLDMPRRFKWKNISEVFKDRSRFNQNALQNGCEVPTLADLVPPIAQEFQDMLTGINATYRTGYSLHEIYVLLVQRARIDFRRMLQGKEGYPDLSVVRRDHPELLEGTFDLSQSGDFTIPCAGALISSHWFFQKFGEHRRERLGLDSNVPVAVRGVWAPDGRRLVKGDVERASSFSVSHLGVWRVCTNFVEVTGRSFDAS